MILNLKWFAFIYRYGENTRHVREVKSILELLGDVFEDFILKVLCVAAVVAMVVGIYNDGLALGWIDGTSIIVAIVIIVVVTVANDLTKEKKFQELMMRSDVMSARVRRNDSMRTVDSEELVVGDLIELEEGDTVPADCVLIDSS
jgi:P-type Ca2+ transporter type 2B